MANTVSINTQIKGHKTFVYVTLVSDGSEETDTIIFDSSAIASAAGYTDPLDCTILEFFSIPGILDETSASAVDVTAFLEFDATTDVLALNIPVRRPCKMDFRPYGGLQNYAGSGKTGDIMLTTTGMDAGDKFMFGLVVRHD